MKALTVYQPWASLIVAGLKPYEFRGWRAHKSIVGQRIAIHASARKIPDKEVRWMIMHLNGPKAWETGLKPEALAWLQRARLDPSSLWRSVVLGTAVLGEPVLASSIVSEFGATVNDSERMEHSQWAWPMLEVEPMEPPIAARGAQGFWNWRA